MAINGHDADVITATLMFLKPLELYQTHKPYSVHVPAEAVPDGQWSNEEAIALDLSISNMRGQLGSFSLDKSGFEIVHHPLHLRYEDFNVKSLVEDTYIPQVEAMLKDKLGFSKIHRFDCKVSVCGTIDCDFGVDSFLATGRSGGEVHTFQLTLVGAMMFIRSQSKGSMLVNWITKLSDITTYFFPIRFHH